MQHQRGNKIIMDLLNLLNMYLEFLNRIISASLGYCNKSVLLLGFRVLKCVIVGSTEEERTSPPLHREGSNPWSDLRVFSRLCSTGSVLEFGMKCLQSVSKFCSNNDTEHHCVRQHILPHKKVIENISPRKDL